MVIAAFTSWNEAHERARAALDRVQRLPAHVTVEAYSLLTRLPAGRGVSAEVALELLGAGPPGPPLGLDDAERGALPARLAAAGVVGGASYDGVVALEAAAHGEPLLTLDRRAARTYAALGVDFRLL